MTDTIAAVATAPGRASIGVVRISGTAIQPIVDGIIGGALLKPRTATLTNFLDENREVIDSGIAIYFPAPNSFTGENVLELQGHGGNIVLQALLQRCIELGARLAAPGEFSQRAFLNDKIDLAQAEGIADLIDASSTQAAKAALRSLNGNFSVQVKTLVDEVIQLRMLLEATLDFPEEETDILESYAIPEKLAALILSIKEIFRLAKQGSVLREGLHVVLIGRPNVGKSSVMNALAEEDVAIVTEIPGTTRDVIRQAIQVNGVAMHVIDTAGLRDTQDAIEAIGISRTWDAVKKADLALFIVDGSSSEDSDSEGILADLPGEMPIIRVVNKIDLTDNVPKTIQTDRWAEVHISAKTKVGLELLRTQLLAVAGVADIGEHTILARRRHLQALSDAVINLQLGQTSLQSIEIVAEYLRLAQKSLSEITGEFTSDDLLGEIFSRFCIGK